MKFNDNLNVLKNKNRVIISNKDTGQWFKTSLQCYDLFVDAINANLELNEFINTFDDINDRTYIENLYKKFIELGIVGEKPKKIHPEYIVSFAVTNNCNLKCTHCSSDACFTDSTTDLDTKTILNIFEKIVSLDCKTIVLTGGEPLLRCDIFSIME